MNNPVDNIKTVFERQAFGICEWWGEKLRIRSSNIRIFFIYASFLTIGSPLIIYLIMGFVMNLRKMVKRQRGSIWDM
ncbi:MAG: PspC family transcriptional regulator [Bacteroidetes bacterium]|nr:PspC family transcriptional regulator [Bacteroidota bacterium]